MDPFRGKVVHRAKLLAKADDCGVQMKDSAAIPEPRQGFRTTPSFLAEKPTCAKQISC